jgi:hypothetical protein
MLSGTFVLFYMDTYIYHIDPELIIGNYYLVEVLPE